jgi:hypothetical protein
VIFYFFLILILIIQFCYNTKEENVISSDNDKEIINKAENSFLQFDNDNDNEIEKSFQSIGTSNYYSFASNSNSPITTTTTSHLNHSTKIDNESKLTVPPPLPPLPFNLQQKAKDLKSNLNSNKVRPDFLLLSNPTDNDNSTQTNLTLINNIDDPLTNNITNNSTPTVQKKENEEIFLF